MLEKDLYEPVRMWLKDKGYAPKAEVKGCDVLAAKDNVTLAVELKVTLNLEVILQAADRQRLADIVYIAVPKKGKVLYTQRWRLICHLLKRLEIGLLLVTVKDEVSVEEFIPPVPFDREKSRQTYRKKKSSLLSEYQKRHGDYNTGGVNKVKLVTVYRESSLYIAHLLSENGPLKPKQLRALGADQKKTLTILSKNFYGWFENPSKGVYSITTKGQEALGQYQGLVSELCSAYKIKGEEEEKESRS